MFFAAVDRFNYPDAVGSKINGTWVTLSHAEILRRVRHVALGLRALGIAAQDRVAILSENRPEWLITDYACLCTSVVDVPIYPTLPAAQLPYLLTNSGARAIVVSTAEQAQKVASIRGEAPSLEWIIGLDASAADGCDLTFADLEARGAALDSPAAAEAFRVEALAVSPDQLITLIYTSGTTGNPKGVMLTQDNLFSNLTSVRDAIDVRPGDSCLSFLPLSHIFERTGDYFLFASGAYIRYAESIDAVSANMLEVRPTLMMSVPRLYEKIYARVLEGAMAGSAVKRAIFQWARGVGEAWADQKLAGRTPTGLLALQYRIAYALVFSKLAERTGGRLRFFVSGGAPLAPDIAKFFYSAGLVILEGYGLTETSPVITCNRFTHYRIGSVGVPIDGVEVRIAEDGEILTRGPHVMRGYFNNPEATAEAIDADGWFHTGDVGAIRDGFLSITDRKKDLIVTAGGKNIAPQPIENRLKSSPFVSQAVMIGDKRHYPIVLVVPNMAHLQGWAADHALRWNSPEELIALDAVQRKMQDVVLGTLDDLASFEKPKKVGLLAEEFTVERGELTPTLKVKRRVIDAAYKAAIDRLYADS